MAANLPPTGTDSPAQKKPINIVPLFVPGTTKAIAAPAQLVYGNGPLLSTVQVFTIFWGTAWQQAPFSTTLQSINSFFDAILTSSLMDQLAEYSTPTQHIGYGSRIGTTTITTSDPGTSVADSAIQQMLNDGIANNSTFPKPTANTLYFVYLPGGVTVTQGGQMLNTSSIERFNGTVRERLATLTRKCRHAAQRLQALETGMYLIGSTYNFCCCHRELSKPLLAGASRPPRQTPAMASGLTDHIWSLHEWLRDKVAPPPGRSPNDEGVFVVDS